MQELAIPVTKVFCLFAIVKELCCFQGCSSVCLLISKSPMFYFIFFRFLESSFSIFFHPLKRRLH